LARRLIMFFAIRDDDVNYWTKPQDLEKVYGEVLARGIPISFAVIPFAVRTYNWGDPDKFYQDENITEPVGNNKDLVEFLRRYISKGLVEIMQHGYLHLYAFKTFWASGIKLAIRINLESVRLKKSGTELRWIGEYLWKDKDRLIKETKEGIS